MSQAKGNITKLLNQYSKGDNDALEVLIPQVYDELNRLAKKYMSKEQSAATLQPTVLVNELFLKFAQGKKVDFQNRGHFFAVAATTMRHILVDHAKAKKAGKRGGGAFHVEFDEKLHQSADTNLELIRLDTALTKLSKMDPEMAQIVEMKYFAGLAIEETATALECSPATVKRKWAAAKLWLYNELKKNDE